MNQLQFMPNLRRSLSADEVAVLRSCERRSAPRFPVRLKVHYRVIGRSNDPGRTGLTVNISRGGMLIKPRYRGGHQGASMPLVDERLELILEWPFLSNDTTIEVVAAGTIVRCDNVAFATSVERSQLRIAGRERKDLIA